MGLCQLQLLCLIFIMCIQCTLSLSQVRLLSRAIDSMHCTRVIKITAQVEAVQAMCMGRTDGSNNIMETTIYSSIFFYFAVCVRCMSYSPFISPCYYKTFLWILHLTITWHTCIAIGCKNWNDLLHLCSGQWENTTPALMC